MSLFAKICKQAKFLETTNGTLWKNNLMILKSLMDDIQIADLDISPYLFSKRAFEAQNKAPCTFINILEDKSFTISVFILDANYTMPLHDHPGMSGLLKVISGDVKIQSYSQIKLPVELETNENQHELFVNPNEPKYLNSKTETQILGPLESNYHEITALNSPAAFMDILTPPYSNNDYTTSSSEEPRHCSFYRKLVVYFNGNKVMKLERIPTPNSYYCDSINYHQPDVQRD